MVDATHRTTPTAGACPPHAPASVARTPSLALTSVLASQRLQNSVEGIVRDRRYFSIRTVLNGMLHVHDRGFESE